MTQTWRSIVFVLLRHLVVTTADEGAVRGAYVALGGSNTCGHGASRKDGPFQNIVAAALRADGLIGSHQNRCVPACGPIFASACSSTFVPASTAFATLEYLPNMMGCGLSLNAWESLAQKVVATGAIAVAVQLVEGSVVSPRNPRGAHAYAYGRHKMELCHARILGIAARLGISVVTVNGSEPEEASLFLSEDPHINQAGHDAVAARVLASFRAAVATGTRPTPAVRSAVVDATGVRCSLGAELESEVLSSRGFSLAPIGLGKMGFVGLEPHSELRVCASRVPLTEPVEIAVGFLRASRRQRPPLGLVNVSCSAGCGRCWSTYRGFKPKPDCAVHNCSFDPRAPNLSTTSTTDFAFLLAKGPAPPGAAGAPSAGASGGGCSCELSITNAAGPSAVGHRVVVRALVSGRASLRALGSFANIYHFNKGYLEAPGSRGVGKRLRRAA